MKARLIAFYLPQFHPIPENDEWWGKGFVEWTTVTGAKQLFPGHHQPQLPTELGFYDLRVPEVRDAQARLAQEHGIEGFCYWHYWFAGKQLLERPFNEVLRSGMPNFPFCLAWANTSWTSEWAGNPKNVLIEQTYPGMKDHSEHFDYLLQAFSDDRYIRVDGKPLFYVLVPNLPDVKRVTDFWRERAVKSGLQGLHLVAGHLLPENQVRDWGFDACSFHYPYWTALARQYQHRKIAKPLAWLRQVFKIPAIYSYNQAVRTFTQNVSNRVDQYPVAVPNWDNTPRVGWRGVVFTNASPEKFRIHLRDVLNSVQSKVFQQRIVFLKSWNEWAEGNFVEPERQFGRGYLEVIKGELVER